MSKFRKFLLRIRGRRDTSSNLTYSYKVYWTKTARSWGAERRQEVRKAVEAITHLPGFTPNERLRRYPVPQIDDLPHAGASLTALLEVLDALEADTGDVHDG